MPKDNNSNKYQNNFGLVTRINIKTNPFTNLNPKYIQHNAINTPNKNILTNIDNNLVININNS